MPPTFNYNIRHFTYPRLRRIASSIAKSKLFTVLAFIFCVLLFPCAGFAQFSISGKVLNQTDAKPVAEASVFLNNATNGTKTNKEGAFTLQNVKPGSYQLVISMVGYETYRQSFTVAQNVSLPDIKLSPKMIALNEVTIKSHNDAGRGTELILFKDQFLGSSDIAKDCTILNPNVLDLSYDDATAMLTASSSDFLEIENPALGYRIKYLLTDFTFNTNTKEVHYEGSVLFDEMSGSASRKRNWNENRQRVYQGSMMHLLRSALHGQLTENGYQLLWLKTIANPQRPADSVIDKKIKQFSSQPVNRDSVAYWKKKLSLPKTLETLAPLPLTGYDMIKSTADPGIFALACKGDALIINYAPNRRFIPTKDLADLNHLHYIIGKSNNNELSLLSLTSAYLPFDANGRIINPDSLNIQGALARKRVAELLPVNYESPADGGVLSTAVIQNLQSKLFDFGARHLVEKVHLHLDRSWYSLGDTIWFKAYTVTGKEHRLSKLSGVMHAELTNPGDTIVKHLTLQLHLGTTHGEFALPYTLRPGLYRIRAYTNVMRNDSAYFYDHRFVIGGIPVATAQNKEQAAPDVQFFPEGGHLVNGLRSRVAFKAVDHNGLAVALHGSIIDDENHEVAILSTRHAGMGEFPLTPETGKHYKAKIICVDGSVYTIYLPQAKDNGYILTINNTRDSISIKITANESKLKADSAFCLMAESGGEISFIAAAKLNGSAFSRAIPKSRFLSGITRFTLFSQSGEPLNERIVFVRNIDSAQLKISGNKEIYAPGEKVKLTLQADTGTFSVAVTNETKAPADERAESSIYSDILLTSELKGYIENPDYYFADNNDQTRNDLDLLMLTQGYRRFEWKKIQADAPSLYQPETAFTLSGTIKTMGGKPISDGRIRLTSIKDMFSADTVSDAQGHFVFRNLNFSDSTKLVINAQKANGGASVKITVDKPTYLPVNHIPTSSILATDSVPGNVTDALKQAYVTGRMLSNKNAIHLKEVQITTTRRKFAFDPPNTDNMRLSANLNGPGNADQVVLADQIVSGGGGKLSELLPGKLMGVMFYNGMPENLRPTNSLEKHGSGKGVPPGVMAIFIDGAQASPSMLDDINPYDVYSIEVLRSASFLSIYGSNIPNGALIITLKHGADPVSPAQIAVDGLITYTFNGFYKAREFYTPKYNAQAGKQLIDDRTTVYWNPDVITTNGEATVEFSNGVTPANYRVVVEGIGGNGSLYRKVFKYSVQ